MLQKIGVVFIVLFITIAIIGIAIAAEMGNARKGKYLYRKNCRTCHVEGGTAKELSPISKTQAEWQKVFDTHNELPCKDEWAKLSETDIQDVYAHLWGHAYDSPSPAKCK